MSVIIGSARSDERGRYSNGTAGDQRQTVADDYKGEVSMQSFYIHSKGWIVLRPKAADVAMKIAANMITACNNKNLGYDQAGRLGVIQYGINSNIPTECDCSSLVRACVKEATGKDPGNFTTINEAQTLLNTGLFLKLDYINGMVLYTGDVLVTKTKGHTVIVTRGQYRVVANPPEKSTPPDYAVGKMYTLKNDLLVRSGPGTEYYTYKYSELPAALEKKDVNRDGRLDKGCNVKCRAIKKLKNGNIWIRILEHDYWIIAYNKEKNNYNLI